MGETEKLLFDIKLYKKDGDFSIVEFQKTRGNVMDFYKKIKTFREVLSQIEAPVKETHETH